MALGAITWDLPQEREGLALVRVTEVDAVGGGGGAGGGGAGHASSFR